MNDIPPTPVSYAADGQIQCFEADQLKEWLDALAKAPGIEFREGIEMVRDALFGDLVL